MFYQNRQIHFSDDEIRLLIDKTRLGDLAARNALVLTNVGLVISISKKYFRLTNALSFDDLVQEGMLGLIVAINKYDPTKNCKISTYATWLIRHSILKAIVEQSSLIKKPQYITAQKLRIKNAIKLLSNTLLHEPTTAELASFLELTELQYNKLVNYINDNSYSLDVISGKINIPAHAEEKHDVIFSNLEKTTTTVLQNLSTQEKQILKLRFEI